MWPLGRWGRAILGQGHIGQGSQGCGLLAGRAGFGQGRAGRAGPGRAGLHGQDRRARVAGAGLLDQNLGQLSCHRAVCLQGGLNQVEVKLGRPEVSSMLGLATAPDMHGFGTRGHSMGQGWERLQYNVESGIMHGYQLATSAGPLCDEAMWGMAFEVEVRLNVPEGDDNPGSVNLAEEVYGPFSGQVIGQTP